MFKKKHNNFYTYIVLFLRLFIKLPVVEILASRSSVFEIIGKAENSLKPPQEFRLSASQSEV